MASKGLFSSIGHALIATVAAVALAGAAPAVAETGSAGKGLSGTPTSRNATDLSARRRVHRGGGAGAVAIAAPPNRRVYDQGDYECSPVHCGPNYKRGHLYGGYGTPIFTGL
jgi:hypothetical protein